MQAAVIAKSLEKAFSEFCSVNFNDSKLASESLPKFRQIQITDIVIQSAIFANVGLCLIEIFIVVPRPLCLLNVRSLNLCVFGQTV